MKNWNPDWYCPTGYTAVVILKERNWTEQHFSELMGMPIEWTSRFLIGEEIVDETIAKKLEAVLGSTSRFWLARENRYRKDKLRLEGTE